MYDLESEWPAHNQGKTPGWLAGEKTQYKNTIHYNNEIVKIIQLQLLRSSTNTKAKTLNIKANIMVCS